MMVIGAISRECATERTLAEHNNMIQAFAANGANEPFHISPLPGRVGRRQHLFDPHRLDLTDKLLTEDPIAVAQQIAWRTLPRKSVPKLLHRPLNCQMSGDANLENAPAIMRQHQEHAEYLEPNCWHSEKVHRHDTLHIIFQKRSPSLWRRLAIAQHVFGYRRLGDRDSEFEQLAVYSWSTPHRIVATHHPDQITNFLRQDGPPALAAPNFPCPIETKALAMPSDDCLLASRSAGRISSPARHGVTKSKASDL